MPTQNLLRFVTVANVDDEDRVCNSLHIYVHMISAIRFGMTGPKI